MTVEELKRHLKYTKNKHRNDLVPTSGTNISIMCEDVLTTIENLETEIRADERVKAVDEFIEWLYRRRDISFHEKQYMKEWFLAEQLKEKSNE